MRSNYDFMKSRLEKVLSWLFIDRDNDLLKDSKVMAILNKLNNNMVSLVCFTSSLACLWYESFFTKLGLGWVETMNLGAIFLVLALIFCDKRRIRATRAVIYLVLFILVLLASGLWASVNNLELGMILTGMVLFGQFVLSFIVASTYRSKLAFINVILVLSLPFLFFGLFQGLCGQETSRLWVSGVESLVDSRAFAFFGSPNVLGSLSMILAIMACAAFFDKKRWYHLFYLVISVIVLTMTFSRSAWLGLFVGVLVAALIKNWRLILLAPLALVGLFIPSIRQRIFVAFSPGYFVDASIDGRVWSFNNAMEIFRRSPLLGSGPGSYGGQTSIYYNSPIYLQGMHNGYIALPYTDNQWLQILVQTGIFGAITVAGFFISHVVNNVRQYRLSGSYISLGVVAATIAVFVSGVFGNIWEFGAVAVLAGAYLGLGNSYEK